MYRRQFILDDHGSIRFPFGHMEHQHSPRKARTYNISGVFQPSLLYKNMITNDTLSKWINKKFIQWDGESPLAYIMAVRLGKFDSNKYVHEFEISNYCKPHIYRILYLNSDGTFKSKPSVDY